LYLNFSVYCFEIYGTAEHRDKAVEIARQGIQMAEEDIENLEG